MLDFDDEAKVTDYQVWADSGAAFLARKGQLNAKKDVNTSLLRFCGYMLRYLISGVREHDQERVK